MKKKILSLLIPIISAVICGYVMGKFVYNNYQNDITGDLMVGKIVNYEKVKFTRGQERGYFEFGGSTIILLIPNDTIKFNDKIWKYSNKDIETRVYLGDTIGISNINR